MNIGALFASVLAASFKPSDGSASDNHASTTSRRDFSDRSWIDALRLRFMKGRIRKLSSRGKDVPRSLWDRYFNLLERR